MDKTISREDMVHDHVVPMGVDTYGRRMLKCPVKQGPGSIVARLRDGNAMDDMIR